MKQNIIQSTRNFNADNVNYSLLKGDFGKQILKEYNQLVQDEYRNASALNVLSFSDDVVKGSNPFAFILLNRVLQDRGKWVARPADLERAFEKREKCRGKRTIDGSAYVYKWDDTIRGSQSIRT